MYKIHIPLPLTVKYGFHRSLGSSLRAFNIYGNYTPKEGQVSSDPALKNNTPAMSDGVCTPLLQ